MIIPLKNSILTKIISIFMLLLITISITNAKEKADNYSTYPSANSLTLTLNTPILLNPKADSYHKTFYSNLNKALVYLYKKNKIVFSKEEELFLSQYNIKFKKIILKKSLLTGTQRDIAAQSFKFDMVKLSDALSLHNEDNLDISFTIRDVVNNSFILEGYKTIYENGKFSFSEFYTITLDNFDLKSFSNYINLVRFVILNPMKSYTNKQINPDPIEAKITDYSKGVVKYISYLNKPQKIKVYNNQIEIIQYKLAAFFKLINNKKIDYNGAQEVKIAPHRASDYCRVFDLDAIVTNPQDKLSTFSCIGKRQRNINYIPKYALTDNSAMIDFKDLVASNSDTIVKNKDKDIYEIWDLELGVKVFEFNTIDKLATYNLPKDVHYIITDEKFNDTKEKGTKKFLVYENGNKYLKIVNLDDFTMYKDNINLKASTKNKIAEKKNQINVTMNRDVYKLFDKYNFQNKELIGKYVIDTYIDLNTHLVWQNNSSLKKLNFNAATAYCKNLKVGFLNNWRLPNLDEISSIKTKRGYTHKQSISNRSFISKNLENSSQIPWQIFWTKSKNDLDSTKRMGVSFNYPNNKMWYNSSKELMVRCVREHK